MNKNHPAPKYIIMKPQHTRGKGGYKMHPEEKIETRPNKLATTHDGRVTGNRRAKG